MGRGAQALVQSGHPESKAIAERQSTLEHLVRSLQRRAALRQHRLMESLFRHEYFLESSELERWIAEQLQQASSEDYGQDYEHLLVSILCKCLIIVYTSLKSPTLPRIKEKTLLLF